MDMHSCLIDIPAWAYLLVLAIFLWYRYATRNKDFFSKIGIPGPVPWPVIGNSYDTVSGPVPVVYQKYIQEYGKVFGTFMGMSPALNVADVDLIKEITVKQFSKFTDRREAQGLGTGAFERTIMRLTGEHWKHVRSHISGAFTSGKLKQMQTRINQNVESLIAHLEQTSGQEIVVKEYTGAYTMDVIASTAFGIMVDSQRNPDNPTMKHAKSCFNLSLRLPKVAIAVFFPKLARWLAKFNIHSYSTEAAEYFTDTVKQRIQTAGHEETARDFIHIAAEKLVRLDQVSPSSIRSSKQLMWSTEGLTESEILANALVFILAGYDTTATLLQFALYSLARHPDVQQKLRDEVMEMAGDRVASYEELGKMDYMDWVINETLRMYPPVLLPTRTCVEETTVKGIRIPKGCGINICVYNIHHDPENWENPGEFKPERFSPENTPENLPYVFLPFGAGPRNCIGMRLALLEAKAALARIVQRFSVDVASSTPVEPLTFKSGSILMAITESLTLKFLERMS